LRGIFGLDQPLGVKKMKLFRIAICMLLVLTTAAAMADSDAKKSFDALKTLQGSWTGKTSGGMPVSVSFRMTAGDTTLMSEIHMGEEMMSMIHMDGDRLLLTHYCGAGNQPRMQASLSPDQKTVVFDFVDATNLDSPKAGHMHRAVFTILASDHHTEEWDFIEDGKDQKTIFDLKRAK
jgi:hypothetical protein